MAVEDSPGAGRVLVALAAGPLVAEPTWTRFDELTDCRCYGYDAQTGRASELDVTDTGTATVYYHDRNGTLDDDDLIGLQIMLQLYNPVANEWQIRWRGHIDDIEHELVSGPPDIPLANVAVHCTGIFDYLGGCKMLPGVFGDAGGPADVVFYEDGDVQTRITTLLTDAQLVSSMFIAFTGNVDVNETLYDSDGDVVLQALRDAADAEFPGVANVYEDRVGRVVFHGRFARFDPVTVAATGNWDYNVWEAATREDVVTDVAQIRSFGFNRPRARIINAYLAYPREDENGVAIDRDTIPTLLVTDATSISTYGYHGADAPDLIIKQNFNNSNTGSEECALFGQFYIDNYATPKKAIQRVTMMSLNPTDARAAATYDLMCRADISDTINITVDEAGLNDVPFFIDGISVECRPLNPDFDLITFTPNLTPASYYGTDSFDV